MTTELKKSAILIAKLKVDQFFTVKGYEIQCRRLSRTDFHFTHGAITSDHTLVDLLVMIGANVILFLVVKDCVLFFRSIK